MLDMNQQHQQKQSILLNFTDSIQSIKNSEKYSNDITNVVKICHKRA